MTPYLLGRQVNLYVYIYINETIYFVHNLLQKICSAQKIQAMQFPLEYYLQLIPLKKIFYKLCTNHVTRITLK